MTKYADISPISPDLNNALRPFLDQFSRKDSKASVVRYLHGLMGETERKTSWQMSEAAGRVAPYSMQYLLGRSNWDADTALAQLQDFAFKSLGRSQSAFILDETGFIKKGDKSAGVQRQYTGTAGRIENSQVGVFLAYSTSKGHCLVDRKLFLPKIWADNKPRKLAAKIPDEIGHKPKTILAREMLERALANGLSADWVLGDEVYGNDYKLRSWCMERQQQFAVAVSSQHCIWVGAKQVRVKQLLDRIKNSDWMRRSTGLGTKGPRKFDWAVTNVKNATQYVGFKSCIMIRRSLTAPKDISFFSVFAKSGTTLEEVVQAVGQRWKIEECFEGAKGEVGLDHYEVRSWPAWHRHITLAMWAYAYLVDCAVRARSKKKFAPSRKSPSRSRK